jgi:hypothetical protein
MASSQEFDIYSTVDAGTLADELEIQSGTFRSVFNKNPVQIRIHALTDFEVPEKPVRLTGCAAIPLMKYRQRSGPPGLLRFSLTITRKRHGSQFSRENDSAVFNRMFGGFPSDLP